MILTKEKIKSVNLSGLINQMVDENRVDEILFLVPTNRWIRNLKRVLIEKSPNQAVSQIRIETLTTITAKLFGEIKPFRLLSDASATVFIKQIASSKNFKSLSAYRDEIPFGTLDKIRNVIAEYKKHGISPADLLRESQKLQSPELEKALDIAEVYEEYQRKCEKLNAYEVGDVYLALTNIEYDELRNSFKKVFAGVAYIFVDGFSELTRLEVEIISKLSDLTKLFISFDYNTKNNLLYSHLDKCYSNLYEKNFREIFNPEIESGTSFQNLLAEYLFFRSPKEKFDYSKKVTKIVAHNKEKEVELIAKEIKKIIIDENIEPHTICVAFNIIQDYSVLVRDIFEKYGIPHNLTDRIALQSSAPITALISYLEIVESDYYFKNIFRALNNGFIVLEKIDVRNLYRIASEQKIVAGKENWYASIHDAIANLSNADDDTNTKRKEMLIKANEDLKYIEQLLKPFEEKLSIPEFMEQLKDFILQSNIAFKLIELREDAEKEIRAFTNFMETVNEIFDLLREEYGNEKKFNLSFFVEQIRTACTWSRYNVKEKTNYGVLVTSLNEIRGLKHNYLFIGGLCDGIFPTFYSPEIFYSGSFKKQSNVYMTEERYLFYKAITSWNKNLFLSYHLTDEGRETVTSTFLRDLESVITLSTQTEKDFESLIYCEEEKQIASGSNENISSESPRVNRILDIERKRSSDILPESSFKGNILMDDDELITEEELSKIRIDLSAFMKRQYSISQLEMYAKCPYKFFLEKVLGIETIEEPTEDFEAVEMGRLLHTILFLFYTELKERNITLPVCSDKEFKIAQKIIFEIARKQLETTALKSPLTFFEKEKILGFNGNEKDSLLYKFLEKERNETEEFLPAYFEVGFGKLKNDDMDLELSTNEEINVDEIKLRGKIDRIELNEKDSTFNVVDYKLSGAKPNFRDLKEGLSLQLPIYLYVAALLLSKRFGRKFSANEMYIYSLRYMEKDFGKKLVSIKSSQEKFNSIEEVIENALTHARNFVESIAKGRFNLSTLEDRLEKVCKYCSFKLICRVDEN